MLKPKILVIGKRSWLVAISVAILSSNSARPAMAEANEAASPWAKGHSIDVRLISASKTVGNEDELKLGLQFKMQPGWRIYWQNTTGFSFHPSIKTDGSKNVASTNIGWPVPSRIPVYGQTTLGYQEEVVLPVATTLAKAGEDTLINAKLRYLACSDICIPVDTSLSLHVPAGKHQPSAFAGIIDQYANLVPREPETNGIRFETVEAGTGMHTSLKVVARSERPFKNPELVVGGPEYAEFSKASVSLEDNGRRAVFTVPTIMIPAETLQAKDLTIMITDGDRNVGGITKVSSTPLAVGIWTKIANKARSVWSGVGGK